MNETKEWTLLFYFASDNPLAPGIVSQMKSLKNAGYHPDVNVVAYFDPQTPGTPTHVFDINAIRKREKPNSGFSPNDPFVRSLLEDRLWRDELGRKPSDELGRNEQKTIREMIISQLAEKKPPVTYDLPRAPKSDDDGGPNESLQAFLNFAAVKYPAKHYMLFILGHGLVVGDDVFLFDEHAAEHSVTLKQLGERLREFKENVEGTGEFELISFHSCSMSSLEVVFELQDTANYMLASQSPAFVGSWPYREILIRVFNDVGTPKLGTREGVREMLEQIFDYVYFNSTDYLLAGYSFDLCLCDLNKNKVKALVEPIKALSGALVKGLKDEHLVVQYAILLAHWRSQSYFQENYTDFSDLCLCLLDYCEKFIEAGQDASLFTDIQGACVQIIDALKAIDVSGQAGSGQTNNLVVRARPAGPDSQYSNGLSVFFPWARPIADRTIMTQYEQYKFSQAQEFDGSTWFKFLKQYWGATDSVAGSTMRDSRQNEPSPKALSRPANPAAPQAPASKPSDELTEDIINLMFNAAGPLNNPGALSDPNKINPKDPTGDTCTCGAIKNYLRDTRKRSERKDAKFTFPVNQLLYDI